MCRPEPVVLLGLLAGLCARLAGADELSGADKLRVLYSPHFAFTREGLPLVTVRITEGLKEVRVSGALRLLPDGEMGAEVIGEREFTVRLRENRQQGARRFHVVVATLPPNEPERAQKDQALWRERGFSPRLFESGAIFGIRGEVLDARRLLVTVAPHDDEAAARQEARALAEKYAIETGLHTELHTRPHGVLEARSERGLIVRNEDVLWFAPSGADAALRVDPPGRSYSGQIYVTLDLMGGLAVVNAVPEDRLLAGLVPAEMIPSAPLEALKAQAVAARNQLLVKVGARHLGEPYRLCAEAHCQVYAGAGQESQRATQAVSETRGELLVTGPPGQETLLDTVYSSSCGGHTEDNDRAWGTRPDPVLRGQLDLPAAERRLLPHFAGPIGEAEVAAFLAHGPSRTPRPLCARPRAGRASYRWSVRVPAQTILENAGGNLGSTLLDVAVLERGVSGRVVALRIRGSAGMKEVHGELQVRRLLGGLRSALITLSPVRSGGALSALDITGGGHGHGVGMCQYGAIALGEEKKTYRQILEHYYPGSRLRRLY